MFTGDSKNSPATTRKNRKTVGEFNIIIILVMIICMLVSLITEFVQVFYPKGPLMDK